MKKVTILTHVDREGPGTLGNFLVQRRYPLEIVDLSCAFDRTLTEQLLSDSSAVVIMGGPMNVDEESVYPFLKPEKEWIRQAVGQGKPLLGICLGGQLIARALGAVVKRAGMSEIGWYPVQWTPSAREDALFHDFPTGISVFQWHGDTFELPAGSVLLAQGNGMNQAFRYGRNVWALQFHIEVTADMISAWCQSESPGSVAFQSGKNFLEEYKRHTPDYDRAANAVYERFFSGIADIL